MITHEQRAARLFSRLRDVAGMRNGWQKGKLKRILPYLIREFERLEEDIKDKKIRHDQGGAYSCPDIERVRRIK